MNKQLIKELRAVKKAILAEPKKFDMAWLFENKKHRRQWQFGENYPVDELINGCGTTACIAGWHYALFPKRKYLEYKLAYGDWLRLAYQYHWPEPYLSRYQKAKTHKTRAKVAAERIEHFIKTGGEK